MILAYIRLQGMCELGKLQKWLRNEIRIIAHKRTIHRWIDLMVDEKLIKIVQKNRNTKVYCEMSVMGYEKYSEMQKLLNEILVLQDKMEKSGPLYNMLFGRNDKLRGLRKKIGEKLN